MTRVRRLGAIILALAAIGIFFGLAPSNETGASDISAIMVGDTADQARAEGAPQQTVVNGWTTRSLLEVIAKQLDEGRDPRPAALLTLAVLGIALFLVTSDPSGRGIPVRGVEASPESNGAVSAFPKSGSTTVTREQDEDTDPQPGASMTPSSLDATGRQ